MMAATAHEELSVSELKAEIERLSRELDQVSSEKIQSAQFGLVLLEEKSALQQRCNELEGLYENTKHELEITQEALMKLDTTQKVTTQSGIEQENALINESAAMESSLTLQILELESETKQLRHELDRVISERDRLLTESSELGAEKATRESERAALRSELREARQREQRLLQDIENLEDENISLQKQVSALRSSQVEFEGLKHEVRQLREEAENARAAAEETSALRRIAERQLAEALEALQAEREAKFAAKKELDAHLSREAAYNITNLAYSIRGMPEDGTEDEGEPGGSSSAELATAMGDHHADLFSEVHLHEISRLEKQLEQAHNENSQLSSSMRAAQVTAENESAAAALLRGGLTRAASRLTALTALHEECSPAGEEERGEGGVPARAAKWLTWWRVSGGELGGLGATLAELAAAAPPPEGAAAAARAQLAALADRVAEAEVRGAALRAEAELLRSLAGGAGRALAAAAPALQAAADELAALYHHVCAVNGTTPARLLLEHAGAGDAELALAAGELEGLRAAAGVARLADTLTDQLQHLRAALTSALENRHRHPPGIPYNNLSFSPKTRNTHSSSIKKFKELNNTKLKMGDSRKRLFNVISYLQTNEIYSNKDEKACVGRTVKEITSYFENISKLTPISKEIDPMKMITQSAKSTFIATFPNAYIPCVPKRTGLEGYSYPRSPRNNCSLWKDKLFHGTSRKTTPVPQKISNNLMDTFKDSLKSSVMTCVLMLQNIL